MAESGGPTTQSGIYYQNTISALYLGALLDLRVSPNERARIVSVRIEAPEEIDDTIVEYSDGSMLYIQAKEQFSLQGEVWDKFWAAAREQNTKCSNNRDRFRLVLGTMGASMENLRETLERVQGKENIREWLNSLNKQQKAIAESILSTLALPEQEAYVVVKRTRAEFVTLDVAETTRVRDWMPLASEPKLALLSHLRDCCGGAGRIRYTFRSVELSELLLEKFNVRVFGSHGDGLEQYREAIAIQVGNIGVPGTSLSIREDDVLIWPTAISIDNTMKTDFEDEDPWLVRRYDGDKIDLKIFPSPEMRAVILESGAGYGKSTILRATVRRLAIKTTYIPALIHAEFLPDHPTIQEYLNAEYNALYQTNIDWTALCEQGRAVIVIDGVDELSDGARAALVNMIERAAARFPNTSFLIGARDASVTTFPPHFKLIRVQRLDDEQMMGMLKAYFRARGEFNVAEIVRHVRAYQELELLCRIPLFLAIFSATLKKNEKIPTSRVEMLELYLRNAFSPEKNKNVKKTDVGKTQLRRGAEAVASISLKRNEAAIPETKVRAELSRILGDAIGDDCVDTLLQYGLIERRGSRLAFCIPTVQEYLAGCVLAEAVTLEAAGLLENVYRRPWAQAIQYAVEKIDDAGGILRQLIESEDDLFYTSLRLVARCIVNGAKVDAALRESVASRLAKAWVRGGYIVERQIGNLIADGFSRPLHPEIRRVLIESGENYFERSIIIDRASDKILTLECLEALLNREDIRELWGEGWCRAIKPVLGDAVALLVGRARRETRGSLALGVISEIFYKLRDESSVDWKIISDDETLPPIIRAAAMFGPPAGAREPGPELIDAALAETESEHLWPSFPAAYLSTTWWKVHLRARYRVEATNAGGYPLAHLNSDGDISRELVEFLSEIADDPLTNSRYRAGLVVLLGAFGIEKFSDAAIDCLAVADISDILGWVHEVPYFSEDRKCRGIEVIFERNLPNLEKFRIIKSLSFHINLKPSGKRGRLWGGGPFLTKKDPDESMKLLVCQAENLMKEKDIDGPEVRELRLICAVHGSSDAAHQLALEVGSYLDGRDVIDHDDWSWLAGAIDVLWQKGFVVDVDRLWQILEKGQDLPMHSIVSMIVGKSGAGCYANLIDFVNRYPKSTAMHAVYFYFERNAEREGLKVQVLNGKFHVAKI
ncbi:hypothetical protein G3O06_08250 [Burkholderia sp. Ac-20345]|uniref:NACHT domain-containing protein n=1 Tax=Burkholderia sp. Ac-20345 TaxID=2703891 RepID=UPI00197BEFE5|nr:hypothetical protein [Burkholderia sp. Ac-20345]MBN3777540.1 hypothetical protein [Burkholderia sp. Ac-20345]